MASGQTKRNSSTVYRPSIVEWFGDHEGYKCGYCGSPDTNYSHGMWAHKLTTEDYQALVNRGWRRSGKYVYKPCMTQTCCPQYPIVCEVENFTLNKSHKKIIKTMNRYLVSGDRTLDSKTWNCITSPSSSTDLETIDKTVAGPSQSDDSMKKTPRAGNGADPNKPPCIKAKQRRLLNKGDNLTPTSGSTSSFIQMFKKKNNAPKTLEMLLDEPEKSNHRKHRLEVRVLRSSPRSPEFESAFVDSHALYKKYETSRHSTSHEKASVKQFTRFLCDSPLEVRLVRTHPPSPDFKIMADESFKVYRTYQVRVHRDLPRVVTEQSYQQFLVDSPLQSQAGDKDMPGQGSYHTHYILDGKLIAVGVVDILPSLVSSVYLFYDPDYSFLSLGTYAALREICYTRKLRLRNPALRYYNMGFYIHSCPKMKYKGQFRPSFLICPETYKWVPIQDCLPHLDVSPYSRLCADDTTDEEKIVADTEIGILHNQEATTFNLYHGEKPSASVEDVRLYASLVGKTCSDRMLLFRS